MRARLEGALLRLAWRTRLSTQAHTGVATDQTPVTFFRAVAMNQAQGTVSTTFLTDVSAFEGFGTFLKIDIELRLQSLFCKLSVYVLPDRSFQLFETRTQS